MGGLSQDTRIAAGLSFLDILNGCLALIYVAWFILLFQKDNWRSRLMCFYEAGRMGLTTYLMQAVFGLLIYSTLGLELLGELRASISFLLAILIFITQIWIAKQWFKRFNYGPVEWAWRSLTTFRLQPFLKKGLSSYNPR